MEHFVVSARKYRPQNFEDVVGQKAISNTLLNAIKNDHLAQALLFTGPRGVGKTSCARILAKTINQQELDADVNEIEESDFSFNVFELDAASNNSVDDIRNLTDQVRIPPQTGKYKVYIIDEVHMLSQAAFNAFLKTLEEPPKHAIFILATTEKHKIIPTILSRCQIFDFKRITVTDIKEHLKKIAQKEGVSAEDDALHIIAQKADGAMRDALSTYDRVVSYCGKNLTRQAVTENLNVLDYETYFEVADLLLHNQIADVLIKFNHILAKGFDGQHFISGLASHFRDLMVCQNQKTIALLEVGELTKTRYFEQAQQTDLLFLQTALQLANQCDFDYKLSRNQRLHVEICLMQLASITSESNVDLKKKAEPQILNPTKVGTAERQVTSSIEVNEPQPEVITTEKSANQKSVKTSTDTTQSKPNNSTQKEVESSSIKATTQSALNSSKTKIEEAKPSGLSLKAIKHKKALKAEKERLDSNKKERLSKFSQEDLERSWKAFSKVVKNKGQKILATSIGMCKPIAKDNLICIEVPNDTMKAEILQQQGDLMSFLKDELDNTTLDLKIDVVYKNEKENAKYLYTDREKYDKLVKSYPSLDTLRRTFDLDLQS
ncbi:DNA polymerase III subunit gamma/tau [Psychroflexus sp. ALD_RP9]|uniref:DNA polymerase III subunit gamma/tau n=1 Tax=Psychroflexus sp. ALD_RP9 TaxID=2777186 RepID=UPI001A8E1936|nr:DNA polymerase III subunit gamma/tau [Psychroflexus sp. ALD_RP9]QSS96562.1 DNA polymerase III subunit gamma/tau [Psychroflexus sp. ALD_RP9]